MYACRGKLFFTCNFKNELGPFVRNMEIRRCQRDNFVFYIPLKFSNLMCQGPRGKTR